MEEILFWVIYCVPCCDLFVTDKVEETDEGNICCPRCGTDDLHYQGLTRSTLDGFSEEACLKIHDALTRRRAKPLADEMRAKVEAARETEEDDRLGVAPNDPWRR